MLIRNTEVEGERGLDVQLEHGCIKAIGKKLDARPNETVIEAGGGALIPGLHDHHIHLFALAASQRSVQCGPPETLDANALASALGQAETTRGWIRGVGYHESVAGELDRSVLDRWVPEQCLRIQHRSGQAWFLNSPAIDHLGLDDGLGPQGVERDVNGRATGRLFRADDWLAEQLPSSRPALDEVGESLASYGVVGVTDATPANDAAELEAFAAAIDSGALRQRLFVMGTQTLPVSLHPDITSAAVKIILDERALPGIDQVVADIRRAHSNGRTVAFHCVTRSEMILMLGAFEEAGSMPGDRVEHAGITPPESLETIAGLGLTVVTQPGFIRERGDNYLTDVDSTDQPWLYRCKSFDDWLVPLGGSTDAPYSDPDPWLAMQAAVDRRSRAGQILAADECVTPERALALFTTDAQSPGGAPRRIAAGQSADLCLLDSPWATIAQSLSSDDVLATWLGGALTWSSQNGANHER
jgi:predicted amidohydrolase YtcJ